MVMGTAGVGQIVVPHVSRTQTRSTASRRIWIKSALNSRRARH
jgi:hypothetical protein